MLLMIKIFHYHIVLQYRLATHTLLLNVWNSKADKILKLNYIVKFVASAWANPNTFSANAWANSNTLLNLLQMHEHPQMHGQNASGMNARSIPKLMLIHNRMQIQLSNVNALSTLLNADKCECVVSNF